MTKKLIQIENNHDPRVLRIEWAMGNLCNQSCYYCFPGSHEGDIPWPSDIELLKKNFGKLFDHYKKFGKDIFQLYLIGGEPTLWKELPKLTEYFKENYDVIINISTNAYRKLDWWERNGKFFDHVEISVHNEFAKVEHLMAVADQLYEAETMVVANVLMDPKNFDYCQSIVEKMKTSKHDWPIILKTVHFDGVPTYTDEQRKFFDVMKPRMPDKENIRKFFKGKLEENKYWAIFDDGEKFSTPGDRWFALEKLNHFYGWQCNLGVDMIKINFNGEISGSCLEYLYGLDYHYNLLQPNFAEKFEPEIKSLRCTKIICSCTAEIVIQKHKVINLTAVQ